MTDGPVRSASRPARARRRTSWLVAGGIALLAVFVVAAVEAVARDQATGMSAGAAVVLGIVEGLTEWLPISSTGHLTVTQDLLGIDGDAATSYAIAIQSGAILAVLGLYRHRFAAMIEGLRGVNPEGRRTLTAVVVACIPAALVGFLLEEVIKERLFGPWPVVIAWFVGGVVILIVANRRRDRAPDAGAPLGSLSWRGALVIGMAQMIALWPGTSRSLVTILAAVAIGLSVPAAVEFSFLLGFVTLGGVTFYETLQSGGAMVAAYGAATPLLGLVVAFGSALVAMRWMVEYLTRHGLEIFGWYRIAIAGVVAALLFGNVI